MKKIKYIIPIGYFIFLLPFYTIKYYIPDTFSYYNFGVQSLIVRDGFSSLFLLISNLLDTYINEIQIIMLIFMMLSLYLILNFVSFFLTNKISKCIAYFLVLSSGIWFYFYGKIFYDLPFFLFFFSVALNSLYHPTKQKITIFWVLLGFALSWKPYFIFTILGLISLLIICNTYSSKIFCIENLNFNNFKQIFSRNFWIQSCKYITLFILGWCIGNFSVFYDPIGTFQGVEAYPASYNFLIHLFYNNRIIWDHVNSVSMSLGNYFMLSVIIIFFIVPLFVKNKLYLFSSIFINILYYLFITYKSPGYLWHSFPIGIYLLLFGIFILKENDTSSKKRKLIVQILMIVAISIQLINNYFIYLPKQITWHNTTQESLNIIENKSEEIVSNIQKIGILLDRKYSYRLDIYRDTWKNKQQLNSLQNSTSVSLTNWFYDNSFPYTIVVYIDKMNTPQMDMIYRKVFSDLVPIQEEKFDGYSIAVFKNK